MQNNIAILTTWFLCLLVVSCSSDSGASTSLDACRTTSDDSKQNTDGGATYTKSHTVGTPNPPRYGEIVSRYLADGSAVTTHYMAHDSANAKALLILIAGGSLNAGITSDGQGGVANSTGNFLVRSAHRFASAGYRVVTFDRPSDYAYYGDIDTTAFLYDSYRNSMAHAVDLATVIEAENSDKLPVIIAGTSRGAISAVANNTLASGILLSSSVANPNSAGIPVGSFELGADRIFRPTHILSHMDDSCGVSLPVYSLSLYSDLDGKVAAAMDVVSGGFRDTVRNDVCGAFDYHGFTGIETCAVHKHTDWISSTMAAWAQTAPGNHQPVGADITIAYADIIDGAITLSATDADGDDLSFAVPHASTVLQGTVSVDTQGNAIYGAPLLGPAQDRFVFTVSDGKGGVGRGLVTITF